jgi:hypothetical protein
MDVDACEDLVLPNFVGREMPGSAALQQRWCADVKWPRLHRGSDVDDFRVGL